MPPQAQPAKVDLRQLAKLLGQTSVDGEVIRYGDKLILPEGMPYEDAIELLGRLQEQEEEDVTINATVPVSPYDGAYALSKALDQLFGFSLAKTKVGFMSVQRPQELRVVVDHRGKTVSVPWGTFEVPGLEGGEIETSASMEGGRVVFAIEATVKGKYRPRIERLIALTTELALRESIYRGKAVEISFSHDNGRPKDMPDIKFIDVEQAPTPIFSADIEERLDGDVYSYIELPEALVMQVAGKINRGVLLAGPYGTGKTMLARDIGRRAVQNGFTFIYVHPRDLGAAIEFAKLYGKTVLFAEDIESVAGTDRNEAVGALLNKLDGINSKGQPLITIVTTNHHDRINAALLRPGRIDVTLHIKEPDAEAALRLVTHYAGANLAKDDFTQAGQLIAGMIPAMVEEVVNRAKMRAAKRARSARFLINNRDLVGAAESVRDERNFLNPKQETFSSPAEELGRAIGAGFGEAAGAYMERMAHASLPTTNGVVAKVEA